MEIRSLFVPPIRKSLAVAVAGLLSLTGTGVWAQVVTPQVPAPVVVPAVAAPPPAGSLSAADIVRANRDNLVFVQGSNGAGSGFIAHFGQGNYLFTNAHVAAEVKGAAFKTLDGREVKLGGAYVAVGHDIFSMATTPGGKPLEIMTQVDQNASIDDDVVVLGNAEGGGVINTIKGKIVGVGPDLVEVDAPFVPGNSGSPIIHVKTGKVIGVATYLTVAQYDPATHQRIRDPRIRRFGYRLDSVKTWQPVTWNSFFAQADEMQTIEKLTEDLAKVLMDLARNHKITPSLHTNPAIKQQLDWWMSSNRQDTLTSRDSTTADQNFIAGLKNLSTADILAARRNLTYDYFRRGLDEQQKQRKAINDVFDEILQEMRKAR
ncbi:MAG TPA: serine protease [Chthoniobacter sp.]